MSDFLSCAVIEQGLYWVIGTVVILLLVFIVSEWFCVRTSIQVLKDRNSKFRLKAAEKFGVDAHGAITTLISVIFGLLLVVLPIAGLWYLYDHFGDYYSVGIDARGLDTLESVRATFATEVHTHVTVTVADNIKNLPVHGDFRGACVADLFDTICRAYSLTCQRSYSERSVTIEAR